MPKSNISDKDKSIESEVLGDYYTALVKYHTKHGEDFPKGEVRRGALQGECTRNSQYYSWFEAHPNLSSITNMVFGTLFHSIEIYKGHEFKAVWEGVRLDVDEWNPDKHRLLEKKTRDKPEYGEHREPFTGHILQVEYGRAMLEALGHKVDWSGLLYVYKDGSKAKVFTIPVMRERDEVLKEIRDRRDKLLKYLKSKELAPRTPGWQCDYCEYPILCYQDKTGFESLGELFSSL
jgi:CRISPR/Cas system-associated exonuclease Cas4 (RecB family)